KFNLSVCVFFVFKLICFVNFHLLVTCFFSIFYAMEVHNGLWLCLIHFYILLGVKKAYLYDIYNAAKEKNIYSLLYMIRIYACF
ncbi:hypothetical protein ACJX0J_039278, partial [Zea mays]